MKAEDIEALKEALDWAISDIEGRTRYTRDNQFGHCLARAKEVLGDYMPPAVLRRAREEGVL